MRKHRSAGMVAASAMAVLGFATACGSSMSHPASSSPSASSSGSGTVLQTSTAKGLGTIVTDKDGFTLYRFDKDSTSPPMSNCNGSCTAVWPPELVAQGNTPTLKGIDKALVGTVTRSDGKTQITLNGWPLYRYAPDSKPGDTKGQGLDS